MFITLLFNIKIYIDHFNYDNVEARVGFHHPAVYNTNNMTRQRLKFRIYKFPLLTSLITVTSWELKALLIYRFLK